jgi:hypothetical protein
MPAVTARMTTVRMKVARFGLISNTPTLLSNAVSAAKTADPRQTTATHFARPLDRPLTFSFLAAHGGSGVSLRTCTS